MMLHMIRGDFPWSTTPVLRNAVSQHFEFRSGAFQFFKDAFDKEMLGQKSTRTGK